MIQNNISYSIYSNMVEAHANSTEDYLIEGLSFKLAQGASYVTNRRSVSFSLVEVIHMDLLVV